MREQLKSKGSELLIDLADHVALTLIQSCQLDQDAARQAAQAVAVHMADHWGGQSIYFPMGLARRISERDSRIRQEFTGSNHGDLARKYGVSLQWIYKIVKSGNKTAVASGACT